MDINFMLALSFQKQLDNITRVKKEGTSNQSEAILLSPYFKKL